MPRSAVGGLLSGLGEGLVNRAKVENEDVMARRDAAIQEARDLRQQQFRMSEQQQNNAAEDARSNARIAAEDARAERTNASRRGSLSTTVTDKNGRVYGVTEGLDTKDLGITAPPPREKGARDESGLSEGDKRLWDVVKQRNTTKGGLAGEDTTDYLAMAEDFKRQGRADLAQIASPPGSGKPAGMDVNDPAYAEAQKKADAWVSNQAGWLSTDSSDFKDYGGNREQARAKKTEEFYRQLKGTPAAEAPAAEAASAAAAKPAAKPTAMATKTPGNSGAKPSGSGTQQDPYQGLTQEDINWFKANAPKGSIISVQGKLYQN